METKECIDKLFSEISRGKRLWRTVFDIVVFALLTAFILQVLSIPLMLVFETHDYESLVKNISFLTLNEGLMLISAVFSVWIIFRYRGISFTALGLSWKGRSKEFLVGLLFAAGLYGIGFGISLLLGVVVVTEVVFQPSFLFSGLGFFLLVGVTEEFIVRGFILGRMLDGGVNKFLALFISAVIFSLLHLFNPNFTFIPFLNILLAGLLLGASYIYTRNLWFPIALHWFWNWLQGPVLGYGVSGSNLDGSLLRLHLPEPNLINGGAFGFEGSIVCSILMVLGTLLIIRYYSRNNRPQS